MNKPRTIDFVACGALVLFGALGITIAADFAVDAALRAICVPRLARMTLTVTAGVSIVAWLGLAVRRVVLWLQVDDDLVTTRRLRPKR